MAGKYTLYFLVVQKDVNYHIASINYGNPKNPAFSNKVTR